MTLTNSEYFLDFLKENIMNGDIPEIYIDEEILKTAQTHSVHNNKVYSINGEKFTEKYDVDELKEFSIEYNNEEEDFPINLIVRDEKVLINSSILLHRNQWNAIIDDKCHVCNMAVQDVYGHITSAKHKFNLDSNKPLKIFELHIIRRIGDNYHCGICNTLYNAREHNNHIDSMMHLQNMLYATNRAVDVTNDIDATDVTSDSVSCDTNAVCETESGFNSENTDLYDTDLVNDNVRSYASVLRSSKNKSPQYIDFVCDNSNWKIPFNTYHMLNKINKQYYCTICMEFFDLRAKIDHCASTGHLDKLKMCEAKNKDGHLIRRVTTKFYHCGTCNNLVISYQLESHLQKHSNVKKCTKNTVKCNSETNEVNEKKNEMIHTNDLDQMKQIPVKNENNNSFVNSIPHNTNILQSNQIHTTPMRYIVINHFFCNFRLNFLFYHTIIRRDFYFICVLCNIYINDINGHIQDLRHVIALQNVMFHPQFGINLIRMVQQNAHCAICNVVVNGTEVHSHIVNQNHITRLNNSIIHPYPHTYYANMRLPVNNIPVMPLPIGINRMPTPLPIGINRMPINMPVYHHTTNNMNVNIYQTVNAENANISVKKEESKIEELNALKVDNIENEENESTVSISMRNRNDTIETHMSTENILDINTDETKTDDDDDKHISNNKMEDKEYISKLLNEILYIRNRNDAIAMSQMTYNSLIRSGDGKIYCFVCETKIILTIEEHIESKQHIDRMKESKFIAEYENDLLRQVKNNFHCSICNVLFPKTIVNHHINWSIHIERKKWVEFDNNIHKNTIEATFRDENKDINMENDIKILLNIKSGAKNSKNLGGYVFFLYGQKKVMNISFDSYNGLTNTKNGLYCNICCDYFTDKNLHLEDESHKKALETQPEMKYLPACYRKVMDGKLNCVTCNINFPNTPTNIKEHGTGKKHKENYSSAMEDAYTIV